MTKKTYINFSAPVVFEGDAGTPYEFGDILKAGLHESRHAYHRWAYNYYKNGPRPIPHHIHVAITKLVAARSKDNPDNLNADNIDTPEKWIKYHGLADEKDAETVARYILDELEKTIAGQGISL
jgi:hypothetical protein